MSVVICSECVDNVDNPRMKLGSMQHVCVFGLFFKALIQIFALMMSV